MEHISFEGVNLAELLPRIPDSIKNDLPFGLVKLDLTGKILEYNMAEGELTGVDPNWAMGKNFFDDVALCTKTQAFYGRFLEGVKKGFINAVFDYTFDHREIATRVKVHMVMMPDHLGRKSVMILVKRADTPVVRDAFSETQIPIDTLSPATQPMPQANAMPANFAAIAAANAANAQAQAGPSVQDIVAAVIAVMNQNNASNIVASPAPAQALAPAPAPMPAPAPAPQAAPSGGLSGKSKHEDILKF
jgi:photoactive yellow protein